MAGGALAASLDQALERLRSDDAWGEVRLCLRSKLTKQQLLKLAEALKKVGPIPSALATGHVLAVLAVPVAVNSNFREDLQFGFPEGPPNQIVLPSNSIFGRLAG